MSSIGKTCPDFGDKAVHRLLVACRTRPSSTGQGAEREAMLNELYAGLYRRIMIFSNLPFARLDRMAGAHAPR